MVDGIDGKNSGLWVKLGDTTKDRTYLKSLYTKIDSVLNGKTEISVDVLKNDSIFLNMSKEATTRFYSIANLDGNAKTFSAEELRVLYSLADASLKDNKFVFDTKFSADINSGLVQANDKEYDLVVNNLVDSKKKIAHVDQNKFNRTKPFEERVASKNVDESMMALQEKLSSGYVDKRTGEPMSIPQVIVAFEDFVENSYDKKYDDGFYTGVAKDFTEQTGIPVSDFGRLRCMGDGDSFTIGDWKYEQGTITNTQTGEVIKGNNTEWANTCPETTPAANGRVFMIESYEDGKGVKIEYEYGDDENIVPTKANITTNGNTQSLIYERKSTVDPSIYNFIEK